MKIALVVSAIRCGGAERVAALLANYWAEHGHVVTVMTFDAPDARPFYPLDGRITLRNLALAGTHGSLAGKIAGNLRRVSVLRRALKESCPEIAVSFMDQTNVLAIVAARPLGIPVVATEHIDPAFCSPGRLWNALRGIAYRRAAAVVCVSRGIVDYFSAAIRERCVVIYNPLSEGIPSSDPSGAASDRRKIISMGRLAPQKGHDLLIRAFALIRDARPDWDLEIWGEGEARASLEELVRSLGLSGRVRLPGVTDTPYAKMNEAGLFVLASRFEGFGIVLCEAMACGLPVISANCPSGPSEIITDGKDGLLVPPENVPALARAMDRLIGDPALRERLAAEGARSVRRFALASVMAEWDKLFARLLSR